jgi:drug/metabolite transporter (DMT)-like permease
VGKRGTALFAAMGIIWGIPYLLIKVADGAVAVPVLVWARIVIGALILVPIALAQGAWRPEQRTVLRQHWKWLVGYALIEIIVPWAMLSTAEQRLSSSASGLLIASVPVIGALLNWLSGRGERLTPVRAAGLAVGFAGVAALAGPGIGRGDLLAYAEVMVTAICYAVGPMVANRGLIGVPGIAANAACLAMAAVVYTPLAIVNWPHAIPSASVLLALAGLGAICTAAGLVGYFLLIAEVGAARATVVTYLNPAVAVALGTLVLGEPFTLAIGGAFVLILAGSVLATRPAPRTVAPAPAGTRSPGRVP